MTTDPLRNVEPPKPEPSTGDTPAAGASKVVAARMRYIERQARLAPGVFDVAFEGRAPGGTGPLNRHGRPQLPPGQRAVENWPVLDLGDQPEVSRADWRLAVSGAVAAPRTLTYDDLLALPRTQLEVDFHCVTTWSRMDLSVSGVRLRDLLADVAPLDEARFVEFTGYDRQPGTDVPYTTTLPLERAAEEDVMLVVEADGEPLTRAHGGPVRVIVPRLYAWKGTKWLRAITLLPEERLGFWETRGYSNTAEPWFNDRYSRRAP
ncbi:MAG: molybdopterin-dependent oxidoreductase [Planctomycetota bacterium]